MRVAKIVDRWYDIDAYYFRVLAENGRAHLLRHDLDSGDWDLVQWSKEAEEGT